MTVLVTVASKHGATVELADAIAHHLTDAGVACELRPVSEVADVSGYDAVVLGSAVYAGRWMESAKAFVEGCGDALQQRPVWLFSSGPVGDPPKPAEDPADAAAMVAATGAREHRVLAGKLEKSHLSWGEKAIVAVVRAPDGDYRDWATVEDWARDIAGQLSAAHPPGRAPQ